MNLPFRKCRQLLGVVVVVVIVVVAAAVVIVVEGFMWT